MPQKVNPSRFEQVCSLARIMTGLSIVPLLNQESNLQRDLRDSAAARIYGEMFNYLVCATRTLKRATAALEVDHDKLIANLMLTGGQNLAAAYNTLFRKYGHPDPHTLMKGIAQQARLANISLPEMAAGNPEATEYMAKMTVAERKVLGDPGAYIGIAPAKTKRVATTVARKLGIKLTA
jgi:adenylosuccinate lyase